MRFSCRKKINRTFFGLYIVETTISGGDPVFILRERHIPKELMFLRVLSVRSQLTDDERKSLKWLTRGYDGEVTYDEMFDASELVNAYVLRDLYLNIGGSVTQYDTLLVTDDEVMIHEIKNYSGRYTFEKEKWHVDGMVISEDPIIQLKRAIGKLVKLQNASRMRFKVSGKVLFTHINFTLDSDDSGLFKHIVMRANLGRYLRALKRIISGCHLGASADSIVQLIESHIVEDPYFDKVADYEYVRKGLYCRDCGAFEMEKQRFHYHCLRCGKIDTLHTLMLRAIADYTILFSDRKLTRRALREFVGREVSESTVKRYLKRYCTPVINGPATYYVFKYYSFEEAYSKHDRLWRYYDS